MRDIGREALLRWLWRQARDIESRSWKDRLRKEEDAEAFGGVTCLSPHAIEPGCWYSHFSSTFNNSFEDNGVKSWRIYGCMQSLMKMSPLLDIALAKVCFCLFVCLFDLLIFFLFVFLHF